MIRRLEGKRIVWILDTDDTSYVLALTPSGHPEHLYYGKKIHIDSADEAAALTQKREFEPGNVIVYSKDHPTEIPEDMCLEISCMGHGDTREPFLETISADGCRSNDFVFVEDNIDDIKPLFSSLPGSYSESGIYEHLCITLKDSDLLLKLHYWVYSECNVITRSVELKNCGDSSVEIEKIMSMQLDIPIGNVSVTSFRGAWAREMDKSTVNLTAGKYTIESRTGCSSSRANPFFMVHDISTTENSGSCFGFNLIYSGSHYSAVEVSPFGKTRIISGIQPSGSRFVLEKDEVFEAPEAVMTFSDKGFTGQSINMHRFVREHILRGKWKKTPRPILLNSWEACYFNISESTLVSLAKAGSELGIELFVMDDGWFAQRNDDKHSLGDWDASPKKLPHGLRGLSNKIRSAGMKFGIWVEPEMISTESRLYKRHPEWALAAPGRLHSEGRNQRILDLANPAVVEYLLKKLTEVFSSGDISYVKWDMNRIFSDAYSPYLPKERQGECMHRYICGLYKLMKNLVLLFPDILFEGCASGGNRFDLGILCYFPQIWASDNTDPISRMNIQEGYSYGYPQCCIGAHYAASPNHQTLRSTPSSTRFTTAAFGVLGYECDVRDLSSAQKQEIKKQTELYKKWRSVLQYGQFYRIRSDNIHQWICVSPDRKMAVGCLLQELVRPNSQHEVFTAKGLDPDMLYRFYSLPLSVDVKQFGSLINTVSPIHVRQDSVLHNMISGIVKLPGEAENIVVSGSLLMNSGISLLQAFSGTGFNENVRIFPDFSSRLFFIEPAADLR